MQMPSKIVGADLVEKKFMICNSKKMYLSGRDMKFKFAIVSVGGKNY